MTPEMIERARRNAGEGRAITNVEFHLATIDKLPLPDNSVDCVISNCVINLAPDKQAVFREIARVLKPGGRLAVSDIALKKPLPAEVSQRPAGLRRLHRRSDSDRRLQAGLIEAGFAHAEIIDTKRDLNVYSKVENQEGCCSTPAATSTALPVASASCCGSTNASPATDKLALDRLADLLTRYSVNDYAASVKVLRSQAGKLSSGNSAFDETHM